MMLLQHLGNNGTTRGLAISIALSLVLLLLVREDAAGGVVLMVQAFVPVSLTRQRTITTTTTRLHVFERMSEGCIAAVMAAQQQAGNLQLPHVGNEVMMAGCISEPETRALERTLQQYSITWRSVQRTVQEMYDDTNGNDSDGNNDNKNSRQNQGWLAGFKSAATKNDGDRPFSKELKQTFLHASKLADQMGSTQVQSPHLFLALLEYKEPQGSSSSSSKNGGSSSPSAATIGDDDVCKCGGWAVLVKMKSFNANQVSALDICQSLLSNMKKESDNDNVGNGRELVTGAASSGASSTPTLSECGTDLTLLAADGLLDPVHGREAEIRSCLRTLIRRRKNNVCLIGDAGVGKTAIAEGVAQILVDPVKCPPRLRGHRLVSLDLASLVAGTKYRGEFEERLQAIIKEVTNPKATVRTILFLDEIHNLVGAGAAEGGMDGANILKPVLARGECQIMGATTISEYRKYIEKDAALERRLQPVMVKEPSVSQTVSILEAVQSNYEQHHQVRYTRDALEAAAALSDRYITDRFLPDKALDLLDEAGAIAHLDNSLNNDAIDNDHDDDDDDDDDDDEEQLVLVTEHTVASVISEMTGIPLGKLESNEMDRLIALEGEMTRRIKGQGRAVRGVARAVRRARSGLRDPHRPVASFLFCGPTGVGKTELCKTLAETYFGSEKDMIRIDMSEYMEKHSVSRLTGPPPGYIGYEEGGQLTEAVRRSPHSVILLDEVEKAHGDVLNILLQVMEDGVLTDGKGRTVSFKNAIVVMTSNAGSKRILEVARNSSPSSSSSSSSSPVASSTLATPPKVPVNGSSKPPELITTDIPPSSPKPVSPEEVMQKMQANPKAASMLLEAAQNEQIMKAMRTAMDGSPADLARAARENPTVAEFLQKLWGALEGDDVVNDAINVDNKQKQQQQQQQQQPKTSGLNAIRGSLQESLSQGADSSDAASTNVDGAHPLYPELARVVKEELEGTFKPELLNRIDEIVVFSPLSTNDLCGIARLIVDRIVKRAAISDRKVKLTVKESVIERITQQGSANANQFGARPMRRAAQRYVEDSLSDAIIQGFLHLGDAATLDLLLKTSNNEKTPGGKDCVVVERTRDGGRLVVEVEDDHGGIGSKAAAKSSSNQIPANEDTDTTTPTNGPNGLHLASAAQ